MQASVKQLKQLDSLYDEIGFYITASEGEFWGESITRDPKTFKRLILLQAKMERVMQRYFVDFANNRVVDLVDWRQYDDEVRKARKAAEKISVDVNVQVLEREENTLIKIVLQLLFDGYDIGADAGQTIYKIPVEYQNMIDIAETEARAHAGELVKGLNKTTTNQIRNSIANSIKLGENSDQAAKRLIKIVKNPVRAQLIAHQESVNAYGGGIFNYGKLTGAQYKVWSSVLDGNTTPICIQLAQNYGSPAQAVKFDEPFVFTAGHGGAVMRNPAHLRCRSGIYLIYGNKKELSL